MKKKINSNIILTKKKKNSHNDIVNISSSNKKIKIETSFDENNLIKTKNLNNSDNKKQKSFKQNSNSNVNKVLIFEIGNNKMINNKNNNDINSNLNKSQNSNNHSYNNIIHRENSKINNQMMNNHESTPKKNKLTDIIKKNIEYNKENKNTIKDIKSISNNISDSFLGENESTPIDHKHPFNKNNTFIENNINKEKININISDHEINEVFDNKKNSNNNNDKDLGNLDTPILLNTPKLTGRIIDAKLNLFEKVKSITNNENLEKKMKIEKKIIKNKKIMEENFYEIEEIINQKLYN